MDNRDLFEGLYKKLNAQIAIYTGVPAGGLSALQDWYKSDDIDGRRTICKSCGQTIEMYGHRQDCEIVRRYQDLFPD
jgi:hypothetical protein